MPDQHRDPNPERHRIEQLRAEQERRAREEDERRRQRERDQAEETRRRDEAARAAGWW